MKTKVFIDGRAGTTGLRIFERLSSREVNIITLSEEDRKNTEKRRDALNSCDIAFLCLPDDAAIEAAELVENKDVVLIDASTAHRTEPGWAYGFPELSPDFEAKIAASKRIAVPGCHASGFIALVYPLIEAGIISSDADLTCHSVTGYSGGGKKMIAEYESKERNFLLDAPRQYALGQSHKHLKEMKKITGLEKPPVFCPIVSGFYSGMTVTVPLFKEQLNSGFSTNDVKNVFLQKYSDEIVSYSGSLGEGGFISAHELSGKDAMRVAVCGNDDRMILIAAYDNLGKGASGAAIECMNMALGVEKTTGLVL